MDNSSFQQQESDTQQKGIFLDSPQVFDSILRLMSHSVNWLAGLLKLTEEEQEDAGVYLGRLGNE
jgi:hypothetical protein